MNIIQNFDQWNQENEYMQLDTINRMELYFTCI